VKHFSQSIGAIVMGSAAFPHLEPMFSKDAFFNSANALKSYLASQHGLKIETNHLLDLFDCSHSVEQQDEAITSLLKETI
jgi:hypothetical protein